MNESTKPKVERIEEFLRHYETKFWYIFALFITANAVLIGAFVTAKVLFLRLTISFAGVIFMLLTLFFVNESRRYWDAYIGFYKKEKDSMFKEIKEKLDESRPCISQHCAIKIIVSMFLLVWIILIFYSLLELF